MMKIHHFLYQMDSNTFFHLEKPGFNDCLKLLDNNDIPWDGINGVLVSIITKYIYYDRTQKLYLIYRDSALEHHIREYFDNFRVRHVNDSTHELYENKLGDIIKLIEGLDGVYD